MEKTIKKIILLICKHHITPIKIFQFNVTYRIKDDIIALNNCKYVLNRFLK